MAELTHTALLPGVPVGPLYQLTQALCKRSSIPPMPCFFLITPLSTRKGLRFTLVPQTKCPLIKEGAANPQHCTKPMELGYWLSSGSQERRPLAKSLKPPLVLKVSLQPASLRGTTYGPLSPAHATWLSPSASKAAHCSPSRAPTSVSSPPHQPNPTGVEERFAHPTPAPCCPAILLSQVPVPSLCCSLPQAPPSVAGNYCWLTPSGPLAPSSRNIR